MKGSTVDPMMNRWVGRQTSPPLYATLWTLCVWGFGLLGSEPLASVAVMLMAYTLEAGDAARVSWICRFLPIGSTHLSLKMIQRPLTVVSVLNVNRHSSSSCLPAAIPPPHSIYRIRCSERPRDGLSCMEDRLDRAQTLHL